MQKWILIKNLFKKIESDYSDRNLFNIFAIIAICHHCLSQ
jgi:hypothetical protein